MNRKKIEKEESIMYLIIGLGNPEEEYANTRHNMGFHTINKIAKKYHIEVNRTKFNALYGDGIIEGKKIILIKPQTYMNLSGSAAREFVNFYKVTMEDIIIIHDDIDLDKGVVKIRKKGGPGTHNGMKSVVTELATQNFPRVRVGIGTPEHKKDIINYVIGQIPKEDANILDEATSKAAEAIVEIIKNGIDTAMNRYN